MLGGGGVKAPVPAKPVEAPKVEDPAVQQAPAEAIRRRRMGRGYRSTVLSTSMLDADNKRKLETLGT